MKDNDCFVRVIQHSDYEGNGQPICEDVKRIEETVSKDGVHG